MKKKQENKLLEAIKFLSLAQHFNQKREIGTHCRLWANTASVFDGVLAAGILIDVTLDACPHTELLALALARCSDQHAIIELPGSGLSVRSDEFRVSIPCCTPEALTQAIPDAPLAPISQELIASLQFCVPVAADKAEYLLNSCIQIRQGCSIATNQAVLMQAYHGCDTPELKIPRAFAQALIKSKKTPVQFGYSGKSFTVWFDDNSWMQTQLYQDQVPEVLNVFCQCDYREIPKGFIEAVKFVTPFSKDGWIYVDDTKVSSHSTDEAGCKFTFIQSAIAPRAYEAKQLKLVKDAHSMNETASDKMTYFYGKTWRAAVYHKQPLPQIKHYDCKSSLPAYVHDPNAICKHGIKELDCGECIPF